MPRRLKPSTQKTLHDFLPGLSSPTQPSSSSSPIRARLASSTQKSRAHARDRTAQMNDGECGDGSVESGSDVGAIAFESDVIDIDDSDDRTDVSPRRPVNKRRLRKRRANSDDEHKSESGRSSEEQTGFQVVWKGKRKGKRKQVLDDSDADEDIQPKRRKLIKGERPLTPEADDLTQELDEDKILDTRLRTRDKKSTFLQNLEKMKRRKQGEVVSESEEEVNDNTHSVKPFKHARPGSVPLDVDSGSESLEEVEEEDDAFIIEDDNVSLQLPAEFSMSTYQDLTHHFKVICQLFVHLAVLETEDRAEFMEQMCKEQYFSVPLQIARRKIDGTKDSIVTSSIWRTDYKRSLQTYPTFEVTHLQFSVPACDACRLGGRISTLTGRLSGEPYDKRTFEPLERGSDDSESSSSEDDRERRPKMEFHLGRFCARRTRVFHEFTHWEYTLFHSLALEVDGLRHRISNRKSGEGIYIPVAYPGAVKPPENLKDADKVMAWLDSRQIIAREVQRLKQMMDSATNLEVASRRGEDED